MFWHVNLPFAITFWTLLVLVLTATAVAPLFKWRRRWTFLAASGLAMVLFIPSCTAIMDVTNRDLFGVFSHPDAASVGRTPAVYFLPPTARNIVIEQRQAGFSAKFQIDKPSLDAWFEGVWQRHAPSVIERKPVAEIGPHGFDTFDLEFRSLGFTRPNDALRYFGPRAENGAGFNLWYSPSEGVAYETAGYW